MNTIVDDVIIKATTMMANNRIIRFLLIRLDILDMSITSFGHVSFKSLNLNIKADYLFR